MRKSYLYTLIAFLVGGILFTIFHLSPLGSSMEDSVVGSVNPDEVITVYWDNLDEWSQEASSVIYERSKYVSKPTRNSFPDDGILLAWTPETIEKAKENYANNKVYGRISIYAYLKNSNMKNAEAEQTYSDKNGYAYHNIDLGEVFWAIHKNRTWNDIGYNSVENIELWLPSNKDPYYPIYVAQIYASVNEHMRANASLDEIATLFPSDVWEVVDDILDKANYIQGTNLPKINKNTIILGLNDKSSDYLGSPVTSIGIPVYAFWNEERYADFINNGKTNLIKTNGFLDAEGTHNSKENSRKPYQPFYEDSEEILQKVYDHMVRQRLD